MNHPVGNRYGDSAMPLGPNSRSDGSTLILKPGPKSYQSRALRFPRGRAQLGRPKLTAVRRLVYFYYFRIERQRGAQVAGGVGWIEVDR